MICVMKKYLFVLMALLFVGVAFADEVEKTPTPEIYCEYDGQYGYVYVYGEGELTVQINGETITGFSNPLIIEPAIGEDQTFEIVATAQLEGYLVSDPACYSFYIPGIMIEAPMPTFEIFELEDAIVVSVIGDGDFHITMDGEAVYENPIVLPRGDEDYSVFVTAVASIPGYLDSDEASITVYVPAMVPPMPEQAMYPDVAYYIDGYSAVVTFTSREPDGVTYYRYGLNSDGNSMTWTEWTEYIGPMIMEVPGNYRFEGYTVAPDKLDSDICALEFTLCEPESTLSPLLYPCLVDNSYMEVTIEPSEPQAITYWRWRMNPQDGGDWSEWNLYEEKLMFTEVGDYQLEVYSIAPGKLESEHVLYSFSVQSPTPIVNYDFVEDGIYYMITGNGKVSVTIAYDNPAGYEGDIVIPSTVTHDGVTYKVVEIGDNAFNGCTGLTSVSIGSYVTKIGNQAFKGCTGLTEVVLGDYVISVGDESFWGCSNLWRVIIGHGVRSIGNDAFAECNALTTVICKPAVPPVMAGSNCFSCYQTATLHVFPAVLDSYQTTDYWNLFSNIVGEDTVNPMPNDVNGDGKVTISDVTSLIDLLLSM